MLRRLAKIWFTVFFVYLFLQFTFSELWSVLNGVSSVNVALTIHQAQIWVHIFPCQLCASFTSRALTGFLRKCDTLLHMHAHTPCPPDPLPSRCTLKTNTSFISENSPHFTGHKSHRADAKQRNEKIPKRVWPSGSTLLAKLLHKHLFIVQLHWWCNEVWHLFLLLNIKNPVIRLNCSTSWVMLPLMRKIQQVLLFSKKKKERWEYWSAAQLLSSRSTRANNISFHCFEEWSHRGESCYRDGPCEHSLPSEDRK